MTPEELAPLVRATVVDLAAPASPLADSYLVDTNFLFFCYYQRHSQLEDLGRGPSAYQTTAYPAYEERARVAGGRIGVTRGILVQFLHRIEGAELAILHATLDPEAVDREVWRPTKVIREMGHREARLDQVREKVLAQLAVVSANFTLLPDPPWTIPFAERLQEEWGRALIDATDAAFIADAWAWGILNIISDDAELSTVPDIRLYTANRTATQAARRAGRLA